MAIKHRVDRLELRAGHATASVACTACGTRPGAPIEWKVIPGPVVSHIGENVMHQPQPSDWCPRCRTKLVFRIPPPERARAAASA